MLDDITVGLVARAQKVSFWLEVESSTQGYMVSTPFLKYFEIHPRDGNYSEIHGCDVIWIKFLGFLDICLWNVLEVNRHIGLRDRDESSWFTWLLVMTPQACVSRSQREYIVILYTNSVKNSKNIKTDTFSLRPAYTCLRRHDQKSSKSRRYS